MDNVKWKSFLKEERSSDQWSEYVTWVEGIISKTRKKLLNSYVNGPGKQRLLNWMKGQTNISNVDKIYKRRVLPQIKKALKIKVNITKQRLEISHGHPTEAYYNRKGGKKGAYISLSVVYFSDAYAAFADFGSAPDIQARMKKALGQTIALDLRHEFFHSVDDHLVDVFPNIKNLFSTNIKTRQSLRTIMGGENPAGHAESYADYKKLQSMIDDMGKQITPAYIKFLCKNKGNQAAGRTQAEKLLLDTEYVKAIDCTNPAGVAKALRDLAQVDKKPTMTAMAEGRDWRKFLKESKLRIFDFDDTLVKTDAMVRMTSDTGKQVEMTPAEFSQHQMNDKNDYDFSDFNKVINPREIRQVTDILRNVTKAAGDREIIILTARDPKAQAAIEEWLESIGIDISKINVIGLASPDPAAKANWIENKIVDGATDILFLDDSGKNIDAVAALKRRYPDIKIDARISKYGETIEEIIKNGMETK
tara:strand:- start:2645 stop:4072 length:1428 start_codon:yes stop_codon:yes gene_type:complete